MDRKMTSVRGIWNAYANYIAREGQANRERRARPGYLREAFGWFGLGLLCTIEPATWEVWVFRLLAAFAFGVMSMDHVRDWRRRRVAK